LIEEVLLTQIGVEPLVYGDFFDK